MENIENKEDYLVTIEKEFNVTDTATQELIYNIIVVKGYSPKKLRDKAIVNKYDHYRKIWQDSTCDNIVLELSADFNCSYRMVQSAVYNQRKS